MYIYTRNLFSLVVTAITMTMTMTMGYLHLNTNKTKPYAYNNSPVNNNLFRHVCLVVLGVSYC